MTQMYSNVKLTLARRLGVVSWLARTCMSLAQQLKALLEGAVCMWEDHGRGGRAWIMIRLTFISGDNTGLYLFVCCMLYIFHYIRHVFKIGLS